jgi:hypothetical protein
VALAAMSSAERPLIIFFPVTERKRRPPHFHASRPLDAIVGPRAKSPVPSEIELSRIWQALKQAERDRVRSGDSTSAHAGGVPAQDGADRRDGLRHAHQVSLLIYGSDADKQPFHEEAETIDAHEQGCSLIMETVVVQGQRLFLTNMRNQAEQECRVVHVGKRARGRARVGIEFVAPTPQFWRPA